MNLVGRRVNCGNLSGCGRSFLQSKPLDNLIPAFRTFEAYGPCREISNVNIRFKKRFSLRPGTGLESNFCTSVISVGHHGAFVSTSRHLHQNYGCASLSTTCRCQDCQLVQEYTAPGLPFGSSIEPPQAIQLIAIDAACRLKEWKSKASFACRSCGLPAAISLRPLWISLRIIKRVTLRTASRKVSLQPRRFAQDGGAFPVNGHSYCQHSMIESTYIQEVIDC